jgi:hypothetical protein
MPHDVPDSPTSVSKRSDLDQLIGHPGKAPESTGGSMRSDRWTREASGHEPLRRAWRGSDLAVDELIHRDDLARPDAVSELVLGEAGLEELGARECPMLSSARLR